jgi:hypothetical protein
MGQCFSEVWWFWMMQYFDNAQCAVLHTKVTMIACFASQR